MQQNGQQGETQFGLTTFWPPTIATAIAESRMLRDLANGFAVGTLFLSKPQQQTLRRYLAEAEAPQHAALQRDAMTAYYDANGDRKHDRSASTLGSTSGRTR